MDLSDAEKNLYLERLEQEQPSLYQQILPLINEVSSEQITSLLGFHAQQATGSELSLTDTLVDKYYISHELGRGGMGVVYSASRADRTFEQDLAIKFIQPALTHILGKHALFQEAQLLAHLNHPCIAKVFDGGVYEESVYIVMERVEGETLSLYLQNRSFSEKQKLSLFKEICSAIEHAHQKQVLHADLKPENILIDPLGSPKILDFNLTQKVKQPAPHQSSDASILTAYSKAYASPEQIAGHFLTQQSDIYSLGKVLALIFDSSSNLDINLIVEKATNHEPYRRYASVSELRQDIVRILEFRPISLREKQPLYSLAKLLKRRPVQSALTILLLLSGATFSTAIFHKNVQLQKEKLVAEEMMYEVTSLLFHAKGSDAAKMSVGTMLELTRRRILSNPDLPKDVKQKMLLAMLTPSPEKSVINKNKEKSSNN
ncbi:serine/threonine protein kinase [Vibrio splendidus]|uniref:serine/threonine protein kinase n=1 Tax=Vibrio TaxID=662 RepID=UPI0008090B7E|nr:MULTISPECIES: serine/threonine-protein kinase [Vibrio]MBO7914451.1 serine/threonine protein kinase [Vibrio sp. G41H]MCF7493308.1 serine/threonine protein kinase [Vibrio sp. G-C-1]MCW4441313.1 serine/threonine protein kinase [Vibrio splendidus]MDH5905274.1 serine/threonine protein kinase [Vibrio splendidus]PMK11219.1 serine/threonine protein kinase [Vibrio splendidus]